MLFLDWLKLGGTIFFHNSNGADAHRTSNFAGLVHSVGLYRLI